MEIRVLYFIVLCCACAFADDQVPPEAAAKAPWNATQTDNLKRSLLAGYDKFARPSHHLVATNVTMSLSIYHFEFDDRTSIMVLHGWMKMSWNDDKLKWNASDYGGLSVLHVADHEVWQPDIVQYNSASGNVLDQFGNTHCLIYTVGTVLWVPPTRLNTFCSLDFKKWPQDEQVCIFTFGSWTYDGIQLNIFSDTKENIIVEYLIENTEWELIRIDHKREEKFYECCPNAPYVQVTYSVHVRRRGSIRATVLHSQAAAAAVLSLLAHCLPTSPTAAAPRALLAALPPAILTIALFYLGHRLPPMEYTPHIVSLYTGSLYLTLISAAISVLVLNVARGRRAMPWFLKKFLSCKCARLLGAPPLHNAHDSTSEELQATGSGCTGENEGNSNASSPPCRSWLALATFLDRLALFLLLIAFVVIFIVYNC